MKPLLILACLCLMAVSSPARQGDGFNVYLRIDYSSAEKTLELYQGTGGRPADIAALRGSQIALSTTAFLAQRPLDTPALEQALEAVKFNQGLGDDVFRMHDARANVAVIRELFEEAQKRNFGQKVVSTVAQLFPSDRPGEHGDPRLLRRVWPPEYRCVCPPRRLAGGHPHVYGGG